MNVIKRNLHLVLIGIASFALSLNLDFQTIDLLSYIFWCFILKYLFDNYVEFKNVFTGKNRE